MKVYLDNAATTQVDLQVLKAMKPYFLNYFGNASEPHLAGQKAGQAMARARQKIAQALGCQTEEIIFTSGATESINLAHKGLVEAIRDRQLKTPEIVTTAIEHKAVLETCRHLEGLGWARVVCLPVDRYGLVKASEIKKAITPKTILVSAMYVNNEVGTIQPIEQIGKMIKSINTSRLAKHMRPIYFHTDATQAIQYLDCRVDRLGVDLLSFTGHKLFAPKGVGVLYVRQGAPLIRQQDGGSQESGRRAGTENIPYIVGLGEAVSQASKKQVDKLTRVTSLRDQLIKKILQIPGVKLTGHPVKRVPHIASFLVKGVEGEALMLYLSEKGVMVGSGSACTSGELKPSHVLTAMGILPEKSHGSLRLSLGKNNTQQDIDYVVKILPEIIERLRLMAPKLGV